MSSSTMGVAGFLLIAYAIAIFILYHKVFAVVYFDAVKGIGQEIIWCLLGSVILTALTIYLYWVVAIIVAVAGLVLSAKFEDKQKRIIVIVIFLVLAAVVFLFGRNMKSELSDNDNNSSVADEEEYEYESDDYYQRDEYEETEYTDEDDNSTSLYQEDANSEDGDINSSISNDESSTYEEESLYILDNSDQVALTEADLEGLSAQELTYARNEIYARHGYIFNSTELNEYFGQQDWYVPDESFTGALEGIEQQNAAFISEYQTQNGLEYKPQ